MTLVRSLMLVAAVLASALPAHATELAQLTLPTAAPTVDAQVQVNGSYLTAPVDLDGSTLFRIAAPVNAPPGAMPIAARVEHVQAALDEALAEDGKGPNARPLFSPRSLRIHERSAGNAEVLEAVDAKHSDPLPIVTVTDVDARANGTSVAALAGEWQQTLQTALVQALVKREPGVEKTSIVRVAILAGILLLVSALVALILRALWRRMGKLETELAERDAAAASDEHAAAGVDAAAPQHRRRGFALRLRNLKPARRLEIYGAAAEALLWALGLAWIVAATWSLGRFPETTPLAQSIAHGTFGVVTTVIIAVLVSRVIDALIARASSAWRVRRTGSAEDRARSLLRVPTIARAVRGAKTFAIFFIAALSILGQIGVPIGSVVTIGGLTAVALSLAAQNFVRDFLNGFLVLLEDQYVVGDFVTINAHSGLVENLTLRMVQLRDAGGDLITIPHSTATSVVNQSRNWSRVDYHVPIDPAADIAHAIAIVRDAVASIGDPDDGGIIEWIGIDRITKESAVVRASIRTAPLQQFALKREINARVVASLGAAGIGLGVFPGNVP